MGFSGLKQLFNVCLFINIVWREPLLFGWELKNVNKRSLKDFLTITYFSFLFERCLFLSRLVFLSRFLLIASVKSIPV